MQSGCALLILIFALTASRAALATDACDFKSEGNPSIRESVKEARENVAKICVEPQEPAQGRVGKTLDKYCKSPHYQIYADPLFQQHQAFCREATKQTKEADAICSHHKRISRNLGEWQKHAILTGEKPTEVEQDIKMLACTEIQLQEELKQLVKRTLAAENNLKKISENHKEALGNLGNILQMNKKLDFDIDKIRAEINKDNANADAAIQRCLKAHACRSGRQLESLQKRKISLALENKQILEACQKLDLRVEQKIEKIPEIQKVLKALVEGMDILRLEAENRRKELHQMAETTTANIQGLSAVRADPKPLQCANGPGQAKPDVKAIKEDGRIPPIFDRKARFPGGLDHAKAQADNQGEEGGYDRESIYFGDNVKGGTQAGITAFNCPKVPKLGGGSYGDPECVGILLPEEVDRFWDNYLSPYKSFDDHNRPLIYSHCSTSGPAKCAEVMNSILGNEADGKALTENTLKRYRDYISDAGPGHQAFSAEYVNREAARQVERGLNYIQEGNVSYGVALINVAGRLCRKHYQVYGVWERNCPAAGGANYVPAE